VADLVVAKLDNGSAVNGERPFCRCQRTDRAAQLSVGDYLY
jgi:hypothetical protein